MFKGKTDEADCGWDTSGLHDCNSSDADIGQGITTVDQTGICKDKWFELFSLLSPAS